MQLVGERQGMRVVDSFAEEFLGPDLADVGRDSSRARTVILRMASESLASTSRSDSLPRLRASLISARSLRAAVASSKAARRCSGVSRMASVM
ncbi:hypothetical protein GA0115260_120433 [Streptomyces sp. MnatMP-M27]|nr:hypothetical protein GA0115260_120433 [Streptomyces sp. MnatMP-M27]